MPKLLSTIPDGFGLRLADERKQLGLTQSELAEIAGVKRLAQSQYEREASSPTVRYLAAIAQAGINLNQVLFGDLPLIEQPPNSDQYRVERQAFDLVEEHVRQQHEGFLGAEARFVLFQLFKSQLAQQALSQMSQKAITPHASQKIAA